MKTITQILNERIANIFENNSDDLVYHIIKDITGQHSALSIEDATLKGKTLKVKFKENNKLNLEEMNIKIAFAKDKEVDLQKSFEKHYSLLYKASSLKDKFNTLDKIESTKPLLSNIITTFDKSTLNKIKKEAVGKLSIITIPTDAKILKNVDWNKSVFDLSFYIAICDNGLEQVNDNMVAVAGYKIDLKISTKYKDV